MNKFLFFTTILAATSVAGMNESSKKNNNETVSQSATKVEHQKKPSKINISYNVTREHLKKQPKAYWAKTISFLISVCFFVKLSYKGMKFAYNKYRKKSFREKASKKANEVIFVQKSNWLKYLGNTLLYVVSGIVVFFGSMSCFAQFKGIKKSISNRSAVEFEEVEDEAINV